MFDTFLNPVMEDQNVSMALGVMAYTGGDLTWWQKCALWGRLIMKWGFLGRGGAWVCIDPSPHRTKEAA